MEGCEAHIYMVETIKELKGLTNKLLEDQHGSRETLIKLSENLLELQRFNISVVETLKELKEYNIIQDNKTNKNSEFVIKATSVLGFLVVVSPAVVWVLEKIS